MPRVSCVYSPPQPNHSVVDMVKRRVGMNHADIVYGFCILAVRLAVAAKLRHRGEVADRPAFFHHMVGMLYLVDLHAAAHRQDRRRLLAQLCGRFSYKICRCSGEIPKP